MKKQQRKSSITITIGPKTEKQLESYLERFERRNGMKITYTSLASAALINWLQKDMSDYSIPIAKDWTCVLD